MFIRVRIYTLRMSFSLRFSAGQVNINIYVCICVCVVYSVCVRKRCLQRPTPHKWNTINSSEHMRRRPHHSVGRECKRVFNSWLTVLSIWQKRICSVTILDTKLRQKKYTHIYSIDIHLYIYEYIWILWIYTKKIGWYFYLTSRRMCVCMSCLHVKRLHVDEVLT